MMPGQKKSGGKVANSWTLLRKSDILFSWIISLWLQSVKYIYHLEQKVMAICFPWMQWETNKNSLTWTLCFRISYKTLDELWNFMVNRVANEARHWDHKRASKWRFSSIPTFLPFQRYFISFFSFFKLKVLKAWGLLNPSFRWLTDWLSGLQQKFKTEEWHREKIKR